MNHESKEFESLKSKSKSRSDFSWKNGSKSVFLLRKMVFIMILKFKNQWINKK